MPSTRLENLNRLYLPCVTTLDMNEGVWKGDKTMRGSQLVYIISVILILSMLSLGMTGDTTVKIDSPPSGLHMRTETVSIRGSVSDNAISQVEIILDGATIKREILQCKDGGFTTTFELGAGKTSISVQALVNDAYIESGIIVYRDCSVSAEINSRDVYVNMDIFNLAHPVKIISGRSMVPLREFATFFGAKVGWNEKTREITVKLGRLKSSIKLGSDTGTIDGNPVACDPPATSIYGASYVPSRFFSEMVGGGVSWDGKLKRLTVGVP